MAKVFVLSQLTTNEVSLVRRPANRRRMAVAKTESQVLINAVMKSVAGTPVEGEDKLVETLKKAGKNEKQITAAVAAFRVTKSFKDQLDEETLVSIAGEAGYDITKAMDDDEEEEDDEEEDGKKKNPFAGKKKTKKSEDGEGNDEPNPDLEAVRKSYDAQVEENKKLAQRLKAMEDKDREREFVAKAEKDFPKLPGTSTVVGAILKTAHEHSAKFGGELEDFLGKVNAELQASSVLKSQIGSGRPGAGAATTAEGKLKELVVKAMKDDPKLTEPKAYDIVMKSAEGSALYRQMEEEKARR